MSFYSRFERDKQTEAYEAQIAAQIDALKRWLAKTHPEIPWGTATVKAFRDDMGNAFLTATDADWEYSLATSRTIFSRRRVPTEAEINADLIDEVMSALQRTNNPYLSAAAAVARVKAEAAEQVKNGATANNLAFAIADAKEMVRKNVKNERAKMMVGRDFTVEKLTARLNEINNRQRQQPLTGAQLQNQLAQHRAAQPQMHRYHPYELLDPQITVDGLIKILRSSEARAYLRRFGSTQLNDKLFNR